MGNQATINLSRNEKIKIAIIFTVLITITAVGFSAAFVIGKIAVVLGGLGIVAYVFGLRHGVDADHIAAIDNTTRKLMQEGKRPYTVGMWFSLGHSTVVVALIIALIFATRAVATNIPALQSTGAIVGTLVSGSFLWIIGFINAVIVIGIYKIFQTLKQGKLNQEELDNLLENRGFMNRFFRPLFKVISKPWHIYPVGVLFGLGFDTASEVALIAISVGIGVSTSIPLYYILILAVAVHLRHGHSGHCRRRCHAGGLRLGVSKPNQKNILQPNRHSHIRTRRLGNRHHRASAGALNRTKPQRVILELAKHNKL